MPMQPPCSDHMYHTMAFSIANKSTHSAACVYKVAQPCVCSGKCDLGTLLGVHHIRTRIWRHGNGKAARAVIGMFTLGFNPQHRGGKSRRWQANGGCAFLMVYALQVLLMPSLLVNALPVLLMPSPFVHALPVIYLGHQVLHKLTLSLP
jgi:hypothetical protein